MKPFYFLCKADFDDEVDIYDVVQDVEDDIEMSIIDYMYVEDEEPYIAY